MTEVNSSSAAGLNLEQVLGRGMARPSFIGPVAVAIQ